MSKVFCPNCYSGFEIQPESCECGYPFNGNEMDKYKFMSSLVKKEKTILEGVKSETYSRAILFTAGGLHLLIQLFIALFSKDASINIILIINGIVLIGLGFYSYKEPFLALLLGLIILILIYIVIGFNDPMKLLNGIVIKIVIISSFVLGLIKIKQAEKIKKN